MKKILIGLLSLCWAVGAHAQKISQLPPGTTPTGVELFPAVQAGNTVSLTVGQVVSLTISQISATSISNLWGGACGSSTYLLWGGQCGNAVNSVTYTVPSIFTPTATVSGNALTLNLVFAGGITADAVLAAPCGSSGAMSARILCSQDIPAINLATSGTGGVSGVLTFANGGCSAATAQGCLNNMLPAQNAGVANFVLATNGASGTQYWANSAVTQTSGTFTGQISGCTSGGSGTFNYVKTGNIASIYAVNAVTCTSASSQASWTITSVPSIVQPAHIQGMFCPQVTAAVSPIEGQCSVSGNTITVFAITGTASGPFITVGTLANAYFASANPRGVQAGWAVTYAVQ